MHYINEYLRDYIIRVQPNSKKYPNTTSSIFYKCIFDKKGDMPFIHNCFQ